MFKIKREDFYASGNMIETYEPVEFEKAMQCSDYMELLRMEAEANSANFKVVYFVNYVVYKLVCVLITIDLNPVLKGLVVSKFTLVNCKGEK